MICGDIQDDDIFNQGLVKSKEKDVKFLIATPPCQGMSPAGKKDPKDARNNLITSVVEMVEQLNPDYVLIENVMQVLKTKIYYDEEYVLIPDYLKVRLGDKYNFNDSQVIDSKYYGVPQQRKRAIVLLAKKTTNKHWDFPEKSEDFVTVRDAIGDLPSLDPLVKETEYRYVFPDYEKKKAEGLSILG